MLDKPPHLEGLLEVIITKHQDTLLIRVLGAKGAESRRTQQK
jgi:hypothetical protein